MSLGMHLVRKLIRVSSRNLLTLAAVCGMTVLILRSSGNQEWFNPGNSSVRSSDEVNQRIPTVEETQLERRQLGEDFCRNHSELEIDLNDLTPKAFHSIFLDESRRFLLCSIAKIACTNWKRVLIYMTGKSKVENPADIRSDYAHVSPHLVRLSKFSMPEIKHILNTYSKLIFVRHPFTRLLSAYRNKLANTENKAFNLGVGKKIIRKYRANPSNESLIRGHDVTFEEFVKFLLDLPPSKFDPHWRPYYTNCLPCVVKYDFIGKYESMDVDIGEALELVGAEDISFPRFNSSRERTIDLLPRYFANLSSFQINRLYNVYAPDFLMYDYKPVIHDNAPDP